MNILAVVKNGNHNSQLRGLTNKGHNVTVCNDKENLSYADYDVVISLSEDSVEEAFNISQLYNLPFYAHIDWIPPWMVFKQSEYEWGYIDKISYDDKMTFVRNYQNYAAYWSMADVKSMSATCFHPLMKEFIGKNNINIYTKHPIINYNEIIKYKGDIKANQITCVSRFTPHKRVHHLIKALQMIDYDGVLNLVGDGDEKMLYEAISGNININFISDLDKYRAMSESEMVVCLWNGTVPAESLLLGTPVIAYDTPYIREIYGDSIIYVCNNAISELARAIKKTLKEEPAVKFKVGNNDMLEKLIKKAVGEK